MAKKKDPVKIIAKAFDNLDSQAKKEIDELSKEYRANIETIILGSVARSTGMSREAVWAWRNQHSKYAVLVGMREIFREHCYKLELKDGRLGMDCDYNISVELPL